METRGSFGSGSRLSRSDGFAKEFWGFLNSRRTPFSPPTAPKPPPAPIDDYFAQAATEARLRGQIDRDRAHANEEEEERLRNRHDLDNERDRALAPPGPRAKDGERFPVQQHPHLLRTRATEPKTDRPASSCARLPGTADLGHEFAAAADEISAEYYRRLSGIRGLTRLKEPVRYAQSRNGGPRPSQPYAATMRRSGLLPKVGHE